MEIDTGRVVGIKEKLAEFGGYVGVEEKGETENKSPASVLDYSVLGGSINKDGEYRKNSWRDGRRKETWLF